MTRPRRNRVYPADIEEIRRKSLARRYLVRFARTLLRCAPASFTGMVTLNGYDATYSAPLDWTAPVTYTNTVGGIR